MLKKISLRQEKYITSSLLFKLDLISEELDILQNSLGINDNEEKLNDDENNENNEIVNIDNSDDTPESSSNVDIIDF